MIQNDGLFSRVLITNHEAEQLMCPILSTIKLDGSIECVNCVHEGCALWSFVMKNGADINGNGFGKCDLPKWHFNKSGK